jgi:iron complex transport system substrate-binding protein
MMPFFELCRRIGTTWLLAAMLVVHGGCSAGASDDSRPAGSRETGSRIVSLAPSVTEVLVSLDLTDRVVGITRYCQWPDGRPIPKRVGGYLDINTEGIVALEPDLVIVIQDHTMTRERLERLGLATLQVDQGSISGVLESFVAVAAACGVAERGAAAADDLRRRLARVETAVRHERRPTTLFVVGRGAGTGRIETVWVAGPATFYNDVLDIAGGINAVDSSSVLYPELSAEGLLHVNPEVILDLLADLGDRRITVDQALADWSGLQDLRAVSAGRLHPIAEPWAVVPGPGIADLVERTARLLHPEVAW